MNKRLIEDEGSYNPMGLTALRARLAGWLETGEYALDLFLSSGHVVGYAVYQTRSAAASTGQRYVYLRQLYIELGARRFWERAGFAPYATTMVWQPDDP